jgi:hypothetical protein
MRDSTKCRCGGKKPSCWKKNTSSFKLFQVFQVQIFLNCLFTNRQSYEGQKTGLICSGSTRVLFNEP